MSDDKLVFTKFRNRAFLFLFPFLFCKSEFHQPQFSMRGCCFIKSASLRNVLLHILSFLDSYFLHNNHIIRGYDAYANTNTRSCVRAIGQGLAGQGWGVWQGRVKVGQGRAGQRRAGDIK